MKLFHLILFLLAGNTQLLAQQHPVAFATRSDLQLVKASLANGGLLRASYDEIRQAVDPWLGKDIDVPVPKDPAGGYTHEKHKANYLLMFNSGMLYQLTGDLQYAVLVKNILLKYAALNPGLQKHPEATSTSPGRIFWQALNDANWMVYAGMAFDLIYDQLSAAERQHIKKGAFEPEVNYFTRDLKDWFNLIHNHAVWACAGVGLLGVATDDENYVEMALYGANKDGKAGLIAQMDGLFSPDGYYAEGPYYTRYALLPFYLFANAIQNTKPDLRIFSYRNNILQKALDGALQQTNLNGAFFSYNDALKEKTFLTNEMVVALSIAWQAYGPREAYLPVAKAQRKVMLTGGGMDISKALQNTTNVPAYFPYSSVEYTDGPRGDQGGVSIIRAGKDQQLTSLIFKYSAHGMSHGHFDKLNINLYDNGNEILQDYGAARFIGIEQKWGGRYLPETKAYVHQTIAHNTVTVDETSHYKGREQESEKHHPVKLFGNINSRNLQVVSAMDDKAYPGVNMKRTLYTVYLPDAHKPLIIDIFRILADSVHQYDLPFNYTGQFISTNFKYKAHTSVMETLGKANGYQFLWKEAEARITAPMAQFTFLNDKAFYSISSLVTDSAMLYFTRIGANDPNFNLRRESAYILRARARQHTFVNAIEIHGQYNTEAEIARSSYSSVSMMEKLRDDEAYTAVRITVQGKRLLIVQANANYDEKSSHSVSFGNTTISWTGPCYLSFDGIRIQ